VVHRPVRPFQQAVHASGLQRIDPVKKLAAADPQLLGDLSSGELSAGGQTQGQESLLRFDVFAVRQRRSHRLRQFRSIEVKPFRHGLVCHTLSE
jgi:hypothetical protein